MKASTVILFVLVLSTAAAPLKDESHATYAPEKAAHSKETKLAHAHVHGEKAKTESELKEHCKHHPECEECKKLHKEEKKTVKH